MSPPFLRHRFVLRLNARAVYDCVIRTKEVGPTPLHSRSHHPHSIQTRQSTTIHAHKRYSAFVQLYQALRRSLPVRLSSFTISSPALTSSNAFTVTPATLCTRTPPEITLFTLPTGVSRPPTATAAVLAFCGVVAPRDWGVSGGQAVGYGLNK